LNIRFAKSLLVLLLGAFAVASALELYVAISFNHWSATRSRRLGVHDPHVSRKWDDWFLLVILMSSIVGLMGMLLEAHWGRIASLFVFGSVSLWAVTLAAMPENLVETWFSFWVDRWFAVILALTAVCCFRWSLLNQNRPESMFDRRLA
jgi:hypothetical protein